MSTHGAFCEFCELLVDDVASLTPYTMIKVVAFGRFGGYDPVYLSIRDDLEICFELFRKINPEADFTAALGQQDIPIRRALDEQILVRERERLMRAVKQLLVEAQRLGELRFQIGWTRAPAEERSALAERLKEAGIDASAHAAHQKAPTGSRPDPIYVSPFFEKELARQIVPTLRRAGLNPVAIEAPPGEADSNHVWTYAQRQMAVCRGGVMSVSESDAAMTEREIAEGLKRFPNRMIVVAEQRLINDRLLSAGRHLFFAVQGPIMSADEAERFTEAVTSSL